MRVYYDYQIMLAQKFGGISRYVYEVSKRLPSLGADVGMRAVYNRNYYFSRRFGLNDSSSLPKLAAFHLINKAARFFDLHQGKYDIFHPTYYYADKFSGSKLIVTVHDMTHELYSLNPRVISAKRKIIPQADRIIAVSENTKRDILKFFPALDPEIISVIYHGASMSMININVNEAEAVLPYDYILFVGLRSLYKNFSRFTEAAKSLMSRSRELHVLCVGGGSFTDEEISSFGEFSGRFHQLSLSDDELARSYNGARCFVFPSEYEGFGIPLLEAFACSCPVVCSNSSSLPEIAGSAAEYFDPLSVDDMAGKIQKVIEDDKLRGNLINAGHERLKFFDWDKAAFETLKCYSIALKG